LYGNVLKQVPNQLEKILDNLQGLDFELNYTSLSPDPEVSVDVKEIAEISTVSRSSTGGKSARLCER